MLDNTSPRCNNWDHFCRTSEMHWNFLFICTLCIMLLDVGMIAEFSHMGLGLGREFTNRA
jgi:hypothetical protein